MLVSIHNMYFWNKTAMQKKSILTIIALLIIGGLMMIIILAGRNKQISPNSNQTTQVVLENGADGIIFYGITCPHCKEVDSWMEEKNIETILTFEYKEVYQNKNNSYQLSQVAKSCGLNSNNIGVPFMYIENNCYMGKIEIIEYLQAVLDKKSSQETEEIEFDIVQESENNDATNKTE